MKHETSRPSKRTAAAVMDAEPPKMTPPVAGATGPMRMDFPAAVRAVMRGLRVTRVEWANPNIWIEMNQDFLSLRKADGSSHALIVGAGDVFVSDWIVVDGD